MNKIPLEIAENFYIFPCPNCGTMIQVLKQETACCIFRHGVFRDTGIGIPPHAPKTVCDSLRENNKIYGCAQPFRMFLNSTPDYPNGYAETCDYI
jgi:hypothetical protein